MKDAGKIVTAVTYNSEKDAFLLLKRDEGKKHFPGKWEFPSGYAESDNFKSEVLRELKEETGFIGEIIREGDKFNESSDTGNDIMEVYPFLVVVEGDEPSLSREHTDYRWIEIEDLVKLETVKGIRKDLINTGVLNE